VFLHADDFRRKPLQFFDFFCGPGEDSRSEPGSPLILIAELLAERSKIKERGHDIQIFFNDQDRAKIDTLKQLCADKSLTWQPRFESLDFTDAFNKVKNEIGIGPSLVFIDQSGVRHITRSVFNFLAQAGTTDFLFFTASSAKWRFGELLAPEIELPRDVSYTDVHRVLRTSTENGHRKECSLATFPSEKRPTSTVLCSPLVIGVACKSFWK
jgi:three-Cys-motif partner protein